MQSRGSNSSSKTEKRFFFWYWKKHDYWKTEERVCQKRLLMSRTIRVRKNPLKAVRYVNVAYFCFFTHTLHFGCWIEGMYCSFFIFLGGSSVVPVGGKKINKKRASRERNFFLTNIKNTDFYKQTKNPHTTQVFRCPMYKTI